MTRKLFILLALTFTLLIAMAAVGGAAPLPDDCRRVQGTVTCTTFEPSPEKNQADLGTTTSDETQGNTTNKSPEPQDLQSEESCKPPKSQGTPCG
jgi:type 1 fimbria pilin